MSSNKEQLEKLNKLINELHTHWKPHDGQKPILRAIFKDQAKDVFVQAGRSFGKTECVAYALWRYALLFPGSENYYFAPYMKQAREILWASKRLQTLGPRDWIEGSPNNTEMRVTFKNGSFIKCDGSDNTDAYRGVKPKGLIVLDEFKDFRSEFYEAFDPNRAAHNAPMIIIGTPPETEGLYTRLSEEYKANKQYFEAPSTANPYLSRDWLNQKKLELYARGDGDVWEREYMARFVRGGAKTIFPMFNRQIHTLPRAAILDKLKNDLWSIDWLCVADPGTVTTFAVGFFAHNPYTRELFLVDELYEQKVGNTSVSKIVPQIIEKKAELIPHRPDQKERFDNLWLHVYDEAASWFAQEALDRYQLSFQPTQKAVNNKEFGLNQIKDLFLTQKLYIAEECQNAIYEIENYRKDDNGKIAKVNDHMIDLTRYALSALHYSIETALHPVEELTNLDSREKRLRIEEKSESQELGAFKDEETWQYDDVFNDYDF